VGSITFGSALTTL